MRSSNSLILLWVLLSVPVVALGYDKKSCVATYNDSTADTAPAEFTVLMRTSSDEKILIKVTRSWSPIGVDRFYQLVQSNYFQCAAFFRVVPNFVVQFGIASSPAESLKWSDRVIKDDPKGVVSNTAGTLTFATSGDDTRTTQLFVNTANNPNLDDQGFTPIGTVVKGFHVFSDIYDPTPNDSGGINQHSYETKGNDWLLQTYPDTEIITQVCLGIDACESGIDVDESTRPAPNSSANLDGRPTGGRRSPSMGVVVAAIVEIAVLVVVWRAAS